MKPLRILVVEDEPDIATLIQGTLEDGLKATVEAVASKDAALEALARSSPKLAVIDIVVAGASGFDVAQRAIERDVPVLLMSGHPEQLQISANCGFPHLAKPFSLKSLASAVVEIIAAPHENIVAVEKALMLRSGSKRQAAG